MRNQVFHPSRQPLVHHHALDIDTASITGSISYLNPTRAHFRPHSREGLRTEACDSSHQNEVPDAGVSYKWTSRNNRKGRHAIIVKSGAKSSTPPPTSTLSEVGRGIWRMATVYPVWDVSYDVATIFTLGSVIWVINAFLVWLPAARPETEFKNEILYGGGITTFIGATVFEVGSFLLMAEAVNENRTGCFGWALEQVFSDDAGDGVRFQPSKSACTHHHSNKRNLIGKGSNPSGRDPSATSTGNPWVWFPSMTELRSHYLHELGFLASLSQLLGATIFWIAGFTALPGIFDRMSPTITIVFYWTPQVIGGSGFIVSGTLFMLETQTRWYKPAFKTLGWWIGAWNLVGGIGFTVCPLFGYDNNSWAQYQSSLSTFWGSWAFLIGSVIQWYESLGKHPVEVDSTRENE